MKVIVILLLFSASARAGLLDVSVSDEKKMGEDDAKRTVEAQQKQVTMRWQEQVDAARAKHADFMEVALDPKLPIPQGSAVEQWVLDSDIGTEILYHLAKHPDELKAIHAMTPVKAARALWTILSGRPWPFVTIEAVATAPRKP